MASKREMYNSRDRDESTVRKITEAKGMVREARERDCKYRSEATGGII